MQRPPRPELQAFIERLWIAPAPAFPYADREHALPTGAMQVAVRISGPPARFFNGACREDFGYGLAAGARSRFYVKELPTASLTVGAILLPGAAQALFGLPAGELAESHIPFADLPGPAMDPDRIRGNADPVAALEEMLLERLRPVALHPAVALALARFAAGANVRDTVAESGYSARRFIALFRDATGLAPQTWRRVRRFHRALTILGTDGIAGAAFAAGYSDQSHLHRDFVEFAGLTPGQYLLARTPFAAHIPAPQGQFRTRRPTPIRLP